jgi:hypothetical protein
MKLKFIVITLFFGLISFGQSKGTVKGIITDKDFNNEPLPFANVVIKGTSYSSSTDEKGNYSIVVPAGNYTIEFSFLGYESIEEKITIKEGETITINKALGSGSYKLQDVVVQILKVEKKKQHCYSIKKMQ